MDKSILDYLACPVCNRSDIEPWFKKIGLKNISITNRDGNSWSCYGVRPEK